MEVDPDTLGSSETTARREGTKSSRTRTFDPSPTGVDASRSVGSRATDDPSCQDGDAPSHPWGPSRVKGPRSNSPGPSSFFSVGSEYGSCETPVRE